MHAVQVSEAHVRPEAFVQWKEEPMANHQRSASGIVPVRVYLSSIVDVS